MVRSQNTTFLSAYFHLQNQQSSFFLILPLTWFLFSLFGCKVLWAFGLLFLPQQS